MQRISAHCGLRFLNSQFASFLTVFKKCFKDFHFLHVLLKFLRTVEIALDFLCMQLHLISNQTVNESAKWTAFTVYSTVLLIRALKAFYRLMPHTSTHSHTDSGGYHAWCQAAHQEQMGVQCRT